LEQQPSEEPRHVRRVGKIDAMGRCMEPSHA
jgi:hypothetical protein